MAKKVIKTTTEETVDEDPKEISYKEDIKDKSLKDLATEAHEEPKETIKKEPEADPVVDGNKKQEAAAKEPEIDLAENNRKIAEETAKRTREEIADLLKGDKKEETKDAYQEWADKYTKDTGKAPTWVEAAKFIKDTAKAEILAEQEAERKTQQEAQAKQEETEKGYETQLSGLIEEELNELYAAGKLTRIKNPEDKNDPGNLERAALMKTMYDVNVQRANENKPPIYSVARIHSNYYKPVNKQPAGADAMITNNRAGISSDDQELDYVRDVKGKGWRSFFGRK